jgi:hypothetical protein
MPKILGHLADGFTSPQKGEVQGIFIDLKNPSPSAGFEPANLGSNGNHVTTRLYESQCVTNHWP